VNQQKRGEDGHHDYSAGALPPIGSPRLNSASKVTAFLEFEVTRDAPARLEPPIEGASPIDLASRRRMFSFPWHWHWGADGRIDRSPA
jgi:hypothetical protein